MQPVRGSGPGEYRRAYKGYVLGALTLVNTLGYLDGVVIVLLLQPIKADLHLSDTQLGFLTGIACALFYATLGVPIARWADRGNRVTITAAAIGLWGLTIMAGVWVRNFAQLAVARVAAGIGEAGCMPPTYSLVGDYFTGPAQRTRAMAVYWASGSLASLIGFGAGGWLNDRYGWRLTFFLMGIPGLAAAVLVKTTIAEPRMRAGFSNGTQAPPPKMGDVLRTLWRQQSSRRLGIAITLLWTMASGLAPWYAAFMMRSHAMHTAELGVWLGLICGLGSMTGTLLGGYASGRWFAGDEGTQMRISAIGVAAVVPCFILFLLLPQKAQALTALAPLMVVFNIFMGPTFALLQRLVVDEMRATTLAVVMLFANLIGMGIGPQVVGVLSDWLQPALGSDSLRYAMLLMSFVALSSAWHFWKVSATVAEDLRRVRSEGALNR